MVKLAKRIKAVVCASILVASTAIASLVPATQVKAAAPTGCSISIVAQDEYNAGETVKITTSFTGATKVTYEFYSQSFNPYYGYVPSTKKFSVEKALPGTPAIASGTDVIIDIPSNARGTYTVKAVFENTATGDKTTVTAPTKLSVKNSSYDKSMAYYYYLNGNSGSTTSSTVPSWYYYYLLNDGEDDNNALLYYYMSNNGGSISDPYLYYLLTDDEDDNKALLYYYYMNNNSTSSTMPSWYYYYLLNDDEDDNKALLYYYYMNNSNISSTDPMWYYLFR